ncbi:hypothetical protein BU14_0332s0029 [Porphyra umbilicalis]|uniref:Uncharacterized protein n=1 Tax=Porphyra umbilicalis TaxID=2786 RepID=A0A1X6NYN9_PORUM|nr:hypothetical protein BU14_0332s0029 [Porphyra umbilicalis]|eukprot:OSX73677.1 hypothetical protein BU14_0332s0029 [Porphyra umbilicalis]
MDPDVPQFFGFGAFETTAFFTAVLVAAYSLIPNPTGRQGVSDRSEYRVYAGWRLAILVIGAQLILMVVVFGVLLRRGTSAKAIVWVLLLMAGTWAPLAGLVKSTVSSWRRVRSMMRLRMTRNQLAAVAREYFLTGQRGIAVARIVYWASGELPVMPLRALGDVRELDAHRDAIRRAATPTVVAPPAAAVGWWHRSANKRAAEAGVLLDMGVLWSVHQGAQPGSVRGAVVAAATYAADPLVWAWTHEHVALSVTPFPDCRRAAATGGAPRVPPVRVQARYLDTVDELQTGGTLSDELDRRALRDRFCDRCALAIRGAVEAFLESNARGHTDMRSSWVADVNMAWAGHYEAVVDVFWEAAFMDAAANRLTVSERGNHSEGYGDYGKVVTLRMMTLLFLVLRAVMGEAPPLAPLADRVDARLHTRGFWVEYWEAFRDAVSVNGQVNASRIGTATFKAVTRTMQDREMGVLVDLLTTSPVTGSLCADPSCWLHSETTLQATRMDAPGAGGGGCRPWRTRPRAT